MNGEDEGIYLNDTIICAAPSGCSGGIWSGLRKVGRAASHTKNMSSDSVCLKFLASIFSAPADSPTWKVEVPLRSESTLQILLAPVLLGFFISACKTFKETDEESELRSARQVAAKVAEMHPPPEEPLPQVASYRYRREISMYYKLELAASKAQIAAALNVMRAHDHEIRSCYAERLEQISGLSGDLQITFVLQKSTGLASSLSRTGGSLSDLATISCVTKKLSQMRFSPRGDYRGRVHYSFRSNDRSPDKTEKPGLTPLTSSEPKVLPQMQMPAKAKPLPAAPPSPVAAPAAVASPSVVAPPSVATSPSVAASPSVVASPSKVTRPAKHEQKSDRKEAGDQKCSGCKGQDSGKQQAQTVSQKSKNTD